MAKKKNRNSMVTFETKNTSNKKRISEEKFLRPCH